MYITLYPKKAYKAYVLITDGKSTSFARYEMKIYMQNKNNPVEFKSIAKHVSLLFSFMANSFRTLLLPYFEFSRFFLAASKNLS